jgi:hypothetical protein
VRAECARDAFRRTPAIEKFFGRLPAIFGNRAAPKNFAKQKSKRAAKFA